jgi:hypothetical protein
LGVVLATTLRAPSVAAQASLSAAEPERSRVDDDPAKRERWWQRALGVAEANRLFAGLWTFHFRRPEDGLSQHYLLGLSWQGVYATTFISSQGRRIWGLAASRSVIHTSGGDADVSLGYRIGVVRGYDRRFIELAERWPVLPAAEIVAGVRCRRLGILLSYAGIVASAGGFISLGR